MPSTEETVGKSADPIKWRVRITKPSKHDGLWAWSLEWKERLTSEGDDGWRRKFPTSNGDPLPHGNAPSHYAAIREAKTAKAWWATQFSHEATGPAVFDVEI